MLRLLVGFLCTKREFKLVWDCAWGCEAASSLAKQVSWLIFEPWSQKLPMKVLWNRVLSFTQRRPIPCFFGHNIRVRLGCGVRKSH